jgi:hypothetical protein
MLEENCEWHISLHISFRLFLCTDILKFTDFASLNCRLLQEAICEPLKPEIHHVNAHYLIFELHDVWE